MMKKTAKPRSRSNRDRFNRGRGFTLIELLVVISIIAILSVIGMVVFTGVQKNARDSKKRSDVDAIVKAAEIKYNIGGAYAQITPGDFASGGVPVPPEGGNYFMAVLNNGNGFMVCGKLDNAPSGSVCQNPSDWCVCKYGSQGIVPSSGSTISGTDFNGDLVNISGGSCSDYDSLKNDLVGYWKFDEGMGATSADSSNNNLTASISPSALSNWTDITKVGSHAIKNTVGTISNTGSLQGMSALTISAWVYPTLLSGTDRHIVNKGQWNSDPPMSYRLMYQTDWGSGSGYPKGYWQFQLRTTTGGYIAKDENSTSASKDNQWYLITGVYDGTKVYFYKNGTTNNYNPKIGAGFIGTIDDVRVYERGLSLAEISNLMTLPLTCTY